MEWNGVEYRKACLQEGKEKTVEKTRGKESGCDSPPHKSSRARTGGLGKVISSCDCFCFVFSRRRFATRSAAVVFVLFVSEVWKPLGRSAAVSRPRLPVRSFRFYILYEMPGRRAGWYPII
jgi:hypothetical protein